MPDLAARPAKPAEVAELDWLMSGDISIRYQAKRDLLGQDRPDLRARIATEGWGQAFVACRNADGSWGEGFYAPRWACTHYTLLDLRTLEIPPGTPDLVSLVERIAETHRAADGGIGTGIGLSKSDVCVNGMFLNYACYFGADPALLCPVVDFLLDVQMGDGGFNCRCNRSGARHSSLHSTLSVLEGLLSYRTYGYQYRSGELRLAENAARDFVLQHRFYKSDRTGQVIKRDFLKLPFPPRWRYNILRALDHFRAAGAAYDPGMADALAALRALRRQDGLWPLHSGPAGKVHFQMETPRQPSRWNTLMALRVLRAYG